MEKGPKLYEGKAKVIYQASDPNLYIMYFKDDATAFNGKKKGTIANKGVYNAKISAALFDLLSQVGIPTHYVRTLSDRELLVRKLDMLPVEFVVRNVVAGSLAKRLGLQEGLQLLEPVLEYYYKNDELGDPLVTESHLRVLGVIGEDQLRSCSIMALQVNLVLKNFFARRGLLLVDFKLEFGTDGKEIVLGDEISPDTCRFWDIATGDRLDKDRFRRDLGRVEEAYQEVLARVLEGER